MRRPFAVAAAAVALACACACACACAWLAAGRARAQEAPMCTAVPTWDDALFVDVAAGWVPVANDVPLILGAGVRFAEIHEVWARTGYMPTGDDVGYAFVVLGYRAVLRPHEVVRPVLGGYVVALPATCTHDAAGDPSCTSDALFVLSATGGVRIEPVPWLGFFALLSVGLDSYPNPFGMVELGATWSFVPFS